MRHVLPLLAVVSLAFAPPPRAKPPAAPKAGAEAPPVLGLLSDGVALAVRPLLWAGRHILVGRCSSRRTKGRSRL
ncbi:MAG: hypothetical protein U0797_14095 [Gemmataceae bacterium]